jgi:hypothetical protein
VAKELVAIGEMARILGVRCSWLYSRTCKGARASIPHYKIGKYIRFNVNEVLRSLGVAQDGVENSTQK